ncbi:MAG: endolytic transglycosylase MltG [Actinomycetota bacterium]
MSDQSGLPPQQRRPPSKQARGKRSWSAFITGAPEEPQVPEPTPPSSVSDAPLYPPARTRRPVTRVAQPVSATPPKAAQPPDITNEQGQAYVPLALPDHAAPPGAVLVAGVDEHGVEYVLEDDPDALPMVDPRYDHEDRNWVRYRTSWGGFLRLVLFVLVIIWLITTVRGRIYGWVDAQIEPDGPAGELVEITIPSGASTNNVATILETEGVISNATVFRYWLRCEGELTIRDFLGCDAERSFQAGDYEINQNLSFEAAVATLDQGPIPEIFVDFTIPEGLRLTELVDRLVAVNTNFDRAELLAALRSPNLVSDYVDPNAPADLRLEGTLFPATYDVAEEDVADEGRFLQRMADTFDQRYESLLGEVGRDPAILELGLSDYDVIIIASMIEEEARVDVDRPLMARAIYNRLAAGMRLQIDATIYYGLGKSFTEGLTRSEIDTETPYNTYTIDGLPPTPIAAPGEAALRAALAPADGDFIFWARTDANGIVGAHTFSVTNAEHEEAVVICRDLGYCG